MALVDNAWYVNFGNGTTTGYYGVAQWALGTTYVVGNIVRQKTAPAAANERCFVCYSSTGGTGQSSGTTEPTWINTRGGQVTDNTVKWQEATGIAALNGDLPNTPNWNVVKNTAVSLGQVIKNVAGNLILLCTTAGTAGNAAEPSWAAYTTAGATTADNTVTWTTLGTSFSNEAAPHARMVNASQTNWAQNGNTIFVNSANAESTATNTAPTVVGTLAAPLRILCHNGVNYPPGTANITTGATIACSNALSIAWAFAYFYGIAWTNSSASNGVAVGAANGVLIFENCSIFETGAGAIAITLANNVYMEWRNVTVKFANAGQSIVLQAGIFIWKNTGTNAIASGSTVPTKLINPTTAGSSQTSLLEGLDLNIMSSGSVIAASNVATITGFHVIKDCKLNAGVTPASTPGQPGMGVDLIRSDSGATNYRNERYRYEATDTTESTITRVGGATQPDGRLTSRKIVTNANSTWLIPYTSAMHGVWNSTVGSSVNVNIFGTINAGALPNNDDIWAEVEYLGSSATPVGSFATNTKANVLATGSALTADGSTWNGGGSGAGWSPFKITVAVTPQMAGLIYVRVKAAKPSTTFYVDPQVVLS